MTVGCGLEVEPSLPCPLTLHIYADGLDGSHPHPVVGLAVVAPPLHPLDALDPQRLVVDGRLLELVGRTAGRLRPPHLHRKKVWIGGGEVWRGGGVGGRGEDTVELTGPLLCLSTSFKSDLSVFLLPD